MRPTCRPMRSSAKDAKSVAERKFASIHSNFAAPMKAALSSMSASVGTSEFLDFALEVTCLLMSILQVEHQ